MDTFEIQYHQAKDNKTDLLSLLAEIDDEKRHVKDRLSHISSESNTLTGENRQAAIRQYKSIIAGLTNIREKVRLRLRELKQTEKTVNFISNSLTVEYTHAFMTATYEILNDDQLDVIEERAKEICSTKK